MLSFPRLSLCVLACTCAAALAQPPQPNIIWHNDNSPTTTGANAFPWGQDGIRYQAIVTNAQMGGVPRLITDIFVSAGTALDNEIVYGDIEIKMGATPQASLVNSWAGNNPNPTTVYRGPLRVRFKSGQWTGLGLPATYLWIPLSTDNFVWEVIVWQVKDKGNGNNAQTFYFPLAGGGTSVAVPRAFYGLWVQSGGYSNPAGPNLGTNSGAKVGFLFSDGNVVELGTGCMSGLQTPLAISGDAGKWPRQGTPFNLNLSGAAAGPALGYLMIGASELTWGGIPLPLDLAILNAPGCKAWHDVLLTLPVVTTASGTATYPLPLPAGFAGLRLKASFAVVDPAANAFGLAVSNFAALFVGP